MSETGQYILFATFSGHLQISSDSGSSFSPYSDVSNQWTCAAVSSSGEVMYAGTANAYSFYISTSYGASFSSISGQLCSSMATDSSGSLLVSAPSAYGSVFISYNFGRNSTTSSMHSSWSSVAVDTSATVILAAESFGYIYVSYDQGYNWAYLSSAIESWTLVSLVVDDAYSVSSSSYAGLYEFSCTFSNIPTGIPTIAPAGKVSTQNPTSNPLANCMTAISTIFSDGTNQTINAIATSDNGTTVFAATTVGVHRSVDSGNVWTLVYSGYAGKYVSCDSIGKYVYVVCQSAFLLHF